MSGGSGYWLYKIGKYIAVGLGCLIGLIVLGIIGLNLWLTPTRLSSIVNEKGSEYLEADVKVSNLRFTFLSSFPRLFLVADSISLKSRTLDSVSPEIKRLLPPEASYLGGCRRFSGAVNVADLIRGRLRLHNVEIDGFSLNLVAVNDSLSNYDIFPSENTSKVKIPKMSANSISLVHPRSIRYRSLQSGLNGEVDLAEICLLEHSGRPSRPNSYDLNLSGRIRAAVDSLIILPDFPFTLDGIVDLHFNPFGISFKDYSIALGNVRSRASMSFEAGTAPRISNLSFDIESFHLMKLLGYLPPEILPRVEGLDADVLVNASARLTRPYHFSSSSLPSIEVSFSVPDGDIEYSAGPEGTYTARHIGLKGIFMFDGENPASSYINIPRFRVEGEGIDLDVMMKVADLLETPEVHASVEVDSRIENLRHYFAALIPFRPSGEVNLTTDIDFNLPSFSATELKDVRLNGELRMENARFSIPHADATATARSLDLRFRSKVARLDQQTSRFPVKINGSVGGIIMKNGKDSLAIRADDLNFTGVIGGVGQKSKIDSVGLLLSVKRFEAINPGLDFTLRNFSTTLSATPGKHKITAPAPFLFRDSEMLERLPHTPELLAFSIPDTLKRLIASAKLGGRIALTDGILRLKNYPEPIILGACDLSWNTDSINIDRFSFRSEESALVLSGSVSNLRQFLFYPHGSVLRGRLIADIDTLNINQLARAYETAVAAAGFRRSKTDSIAAARRQAEKYARQDTTALILPRNLDLNVRAKAKELIYTNLFFKDVSTSLNLSGGMFRIGNLAMQASFAGAGANVIYDTSDIENITCSGDVRISDLDLIGMYRKFPSIPRKVPEVVNLSGTLSLNADFNLGIFPTMSANVPGFTALVKFNGRDLKLHQTEFIHHVARMMLIFSHDDIHIADINISGNVHDNLLELYPFDLDFSRYHLQLQGLNNFGGDLYYHIGVDRSPIPFRFGIEIEGKYPHPRLRFSGSGWNREKATSITGRIMESGAFNFVSEARKGMKAFVHEAAKSKIGAGDMKEEDK